MDFIVIMILKILA